MTQDTKLQQLVINKLTTAQYQAALDAGTIDPNQLYMTTDSVAIKDVKVNGVSVVDGSEADITLGTMASEAASDYSKKSVADTLYAAKSLESTVSTHIANKSNPHQVTKAQVGLGNVDNTSDLNKPISTLTQTALNNKVDKVSTANKIYGTDSSGVQTTYDKSSFGNVDDVKVGTTSVVANKIAVLGTMAGENTGNYYKKTDLASVATSGSWADLTNTPTTIGGYGITDAYTKSEIDGKLSAGMHYKGTVASYSNLPTTGQVIGDLYNVTDTGANYAWNGTAWDKMSENVDLSNFYTKSEIDGFLEDKADSEDIPTATSQLTNDSGFITSITSSDVTTALGYTPYNSTNPSGYITSSAIEGFIRNTATGTNSLTILGNATSQNQAVNIGASSSVTGTQGVAIGYNASTITSVAIGASASANYTHALAIGNGATVSTAGGIQIGQGTTNDASLNVALGGTTHTNYKLLGSDGKIPDDRLNATIARTSQIPTTTSQLTNNSGFITGISWGDITGTLSSQSDLNTALNNKVDKVSTASKIYATDASGNQTTLSYNAFATGNTIPVRGVSGTIEATTPYADSHVTTKQYVDNLIPTIATTSKSGLVKPDGTTITITNDGTISAAGAEIDNETITQNGDNELQTVAIINPNTNNGATSPLKIWNGTEQQWNQGETVTWYYWQTSKIMRWTNGGNLPSSIYWQSITYGNGKFVAVGYNSDKAAYSTDGINWTETTLPGEYYWHSVIYGNGKFVAVASGSSNQAAYSTDGINWTASTLPSSASWNFITYGDGKFVAIVENSYKAAYSTDGINWTETTLPSSANWSSITYGNGKFVAVGYNSDKAAYSTDGINWTETTMPNPAIWHSVTYGDGKFVAVANSNYRAAYSTDGINWTASTLPSSVYWHSVTYGDGKFVAVAYGSDKAAYSTNGIGYWTESTLPSSKAWSSITYGDGKFVAVANGSDVSAIFAAQYNKCYTLDSTPTTSTQVYSEPEITSTKTITSVGSGTITLSDNLIYNSTPSGNQNTYRPLGDIHPDWLCNINNVGVKIGNTIIATDGSESILPSQSGNSGKFLTTDGTNVSWATVSQPSIATISTAGLVKPDGTTVTITNDGTISASSSSIIFRTWSE